MKKSELLEKIERLEKAIFFTPEEEYNFYHYDNQLDRIEKQLCDKLNENEIDRVSEKLSLVEKKVKTLLDKLNLEYIEVTTNRPKSVSMYGFGPCDNMTTENKLIKKK